MSSRKRTGKVMQEEVDEEDEEEEIEEEMDDDDVDEEEVDEDDAETSTSSSSEVSPVRKGSKRTTGTTTNTTQSIPMKKISTAVPAAAIGTTAVKSRTPETVRKTASPTVTKTTVTTTTNTKKVIPNSTAKTRAVVSPSSMRPNVPHEAPISGPAISKPYASAVAVPAMVTGAAMTGANPALLPVPRKWTYRFVRYLAEFLGTFMIAFVITSTNAQLFTWRNLAVGSAQPTDGFLLMLEVIMAHVFVYAVMYAIFRAVSGGHFNPAITFAYMCLFEIGWITGVMYILFQIAGAILGSLLAWGVHYQGIYGGPELDPINLCVTTDDCPFFPGHGRGFLIEMIGTVAVVFTFCMVDLGHMVGDLAFLVIGFVYGAFMLSLKVFTSAFFNPAVALGAATASLRYSWSFNNFWFFIIAPMVASIVAALLYGWFFQIDGHGTGPHIRPMYKHNKPIRIVDPYNV